MANSALGRGLNSLIPSKKNTKESIGSDMMTDSREQVFEVELGKIKPNPRQPRKDFDRSSLEDLINSIKVHGIIQPLIALKDGDNFQLIAGERRLRAAKILDMKKAPVIIRSATDQENLELALVENVQRQNLNPIEKAYGYQQLVDEFDLKQDDVAKKVGQSRAAVANTLRLLSLPVEIQESIQAGKISEGHAKALLSVKTEEEQQRLFRDILRNNLNVRVAESQARKVTVKKHKRNVTKDPNLQEKEERLESALGTRVYIKKSGQQGTVNIHFYSGEELQEIIRKITK